jgi:hypothetical protein
MANQPVLNPESSGPSLKILQCHFSGTLSLSPQGAQAGQPQSQDRSENGLELILALPLHFICFS